MGAVLCGLYTGLRYSDVLRLRWADVRGGFIHVTPSKTRRHGIETVIPVHRKLAAWLDGAPRSGEWVFPETAAAARSSYRRTWFGEVLRRAGVKAAPGEYVGFHSLRHTLASRLSAVGVPQSVAMRIMGHTVAATNLRYTHDTESTRAAVDKLG